MTIINPRESLLRTIASPSTDGRRKTTAENDRIIFGCVDNTGDIHSGKGFTVEHRSKGLYRITYTQAFPKTPAVALTQNYPNWTETAPPSSGNTKDNCVLVASAENWFEVKTGDRDGDASDRNFTFIAAGWVNLVP